VIKIHAVTQADEEGNVHCTLSLPREVFDRMKGYEDQYGEQEGAKRRDRLLEALAAMVIGSIDNYRTSEIRSAPVISEGLKNGDEA
jgi:hypothetical protein